MPIGSLKIDLRRVQPIDCSRSFSRLLGFRTRASCLRSLGQRNHFQGFTLRQLGEIAVLDDRFTVPVVSRTLEPVALVSRLSLNAAHSELTVTVNGVTEGLRHDDSGEFTVEHSALVLEPFADRLILSRFWTEELDLKSEPVVGMLTAFFDRIVDEDVDGVRELLYAGQLPDRHEQWFRMIDRNGQAVPVKLLTDVVSRAKGSYLLRGRLEVCEPFALSNVALQTLSYELNVETAGNTVVRVSDRNALKQLVTRLAGCVSLESVDSAITLRVRAAGLGCSYCDVTFPELHALTFTIPGMRLSQAQVLRFASDNHSLTRAGTSCGWSDFVSLCHESGYHVQAGLNTLQQLELTLVDTTESDRLA